MIFVNSTTYRRWTGSKKYIRTGSKRLDIAIRKMTSDWDGNGASLCVSILRLKARMVPNGSWFLKSERVVTSDRTGDRITASFSVIFRNIGPTRYLSLFNAFGRAHGGQVKVQMRGLRVDMESKNLCCLRPVVLGNRPSENIQIQFPREALPDLTRAVKQMIATRSRNVDVLFHADRNCRSTGGGGYGFRNIITTGIAFTRGAGVSVAPITSRGVPSQSIGMNFPSTELPKFLQALKAAALPTKRQQKRKLH